MERINARGAWENKRKKAKRIPLQMIMERFTELQPLPAYLGDSFGGVVKHGNKGNDWIFDTETIQRL